MRFLLYDSWTNSSFPFIFQLNPFFLFILLVITIMQAVFQRYPRPEKDYLSFSLIYNNGKRSLDLVGGEILDFHPWLYD